MAEQWLEHYDSGVPKSIGNYPDKTLVDFAIEHARTKPDAPALRFKGLDISFARLNSESDALARSLAAEGVKRGDRVAVLAPNCPQWVIAAQAVWKLGAILCPLNPIYTEREIEDALHASEPETAIVLTLFYDHLKRVQPRTTVKRVIATNIKEYLPAILRTAFTLLKEKKEGHRIELQPGDFWFHDLIERGTKEGGEPLNLAKPDDPAVILMSGGTTGTPKGVVAQHRSLVMAGMQLGAWLHEPLSVPHSSILLPLPLFHTYGCAGAQSIALIAGIPLNLVANPREIGDLLKTINHDHPTLVCGVPTLFSAMLAHRDVVNGKIDFKSIRACFSGAAPLMAETKKRFEDLTGGRIVEGYSLTEATMACCVNPVRGANKIGSVGMPVPDVHVKIVDGETGEGEMPTGQIGEITLHAPQLMLGYWKNDEETSRMLRTDREGKKWLFTGDLGYLDEDGYLFIVDRKKDLIKTSGFQVWPREIEEVIATHPSVAEVGVAGVPDAKKGEVITAWIVLRQGQPPVSEAELRAYCKEKLAPYKVPARIEMRKELPKTMVGKVLRRALVAEAKANAEMVQ